MLVINPCKYRKEAAMICTKRDTCVHNGDVICLNCNGSEIRYKRKESAMKNKKAIRELLEDCIKRDCPECGAKRKLREQS